ncbi:RNA polymerase sigma-70 factor [Larkinella arboricola]
MADHYSSNSEAGWLARLREGDESAFTAIYRQYWSSMYAVTYNHVRDRATAEELVQDLFANLWIKRADLSIHTSLRGYLFTAIRNQIYDYLDKQTVRQRVHSQLYHTKQEAVYNTEELVSFNELSNNLSMAVERLPATARKVFFLSRYQFLSTREIAQRLNLSPKTVEYHLSQALRLLRGQLKDYILLLVCMVCN